MKNIGIFYMLLFWVQLSNATVLEDSPLAKNYISRYHEIAVQEMRRTGIPASIKLAQGLLESDWGRSDLATIANNHFGIKCGSSWDGKEFYKADDDYDDDGRLTQSCFRVFNDDRHSYKAHSEFLKDPKKAYRYGFLFEYKSNDYKSWAKGLLKAGYATDKKYPEKLIAVIKKYRLYRFDELILTKDGSPLSGEDVPEAMPISSYKAKEKHFSTPTISNRTLQKISAVNRVPMTKAKEGMTLEDLATQVGLSVDVLIQYNDGYEAPTSIVKRGDIIYLQKKKRNYVGDIEEHIVLEGETMASISQLYGIRLDNLYAKNRMPKDAIPLIGEKLQLRRTANSDNRPKYTRPSGRVPQQFLDEMPTKGEFDQKDAVEAQPMRTKSRKPRPKQTGPIRKKLYCPKKADKEFDAENKYTFKKMVIEEE